MTTKTQTTAAQTAKTAGDVIGDMPASLKRTATPTASEQAQAQAKTDAEPAPKAKEKPAKVAKEKPASKKAKDNTAAIAKAVKAKKTDVKPHQPSTIAPTEQNPAKSIVPVAFKKVYAANNDTCGRPLNVTLKEYTTTKNADGRDALDLDRLQEVATANGFDAKALYGHLNRGQQRMNVGNRLAGLVKQGKTVIIGKRKFANADKALAAPSAQAQAAASPAA